MKYYAVIDHSGKNFDDKIYKTSKDAIDDFVEDYLINTVQCPLFNSVDIMHFWNLASRNGFTIKEYEVGE